MSTHLCYVEESIFEFTCVFDSLSITLADFDLSSVKKEYLFFGMLQCELLWISATLRLKNSNTRSGLRLSKLGDDDGLICLGRNGLASIHESRVSLPSPQLAIDLHFVMQL